MTSTLRTILTFKWAAILCACHCWFGETARAAPINIETVPVRNAGNTADDTGFGAVDYDYSIGKTEITNAQYAAFLNAKAASSDPLGLYDSRMGNAFVAGGISRSSGSGFTYTAISGREHKPVNYVSWYDAIRFTNWLHNGQGNGETENGAYTILGANAEPSNGLSITRNPGAQWWLPSEDEWYKAAYHKNDGVTANYFEYPTSSDTEPSSDAPPSGSNSANHDTLDDLSDAGAYVNSSSPYGTFDQGGNVWEWNESLLFVSFRGIRGGSFRMGGFSLSKFANNSDEPIFGDKTVGFRVATLYVPEPNSLALAGMGLLGGWVLVRRRRDR